MNRAYLSLGSNLGDRLDLLKKAVRMLDEHEAICVEAISSVYETDPVGVTDQPAFLNIVSEITTSLTPEGLLQACRQIEENLDRVRVVRWGPRTMDLDILLYNHDNIETETLTVPHPRMHERAFVLVPLAEIAPDIASGTVPGTEGVRLWKTVDHVKGFFNL